MFFSINGSNGATFFFSSASFADWKKSLEFYQGVSFTAKVKKFLLTAAYPFFVRRAKLRGIDVIAALGKVLPPDTALDISAHDSAMLSPTRDKVIVHHHGRSYEKFAVGNSRLGVQRELDFYRKLQAEPPQTFVVSQLLCADENSALVRFEMAYATPQEGNETDVPLPALAEFFTRKKEADVSWNSMWKQLHLPFEIPESDKEGITPVGAVHRDFKPWNVKLGTIPQFFDFESVSTGLPLEDFFNYVVDPVLHFGTAHECLREMQERNIFELAGKLLQLQGIPEQEVCRYWRWYLLERYSFFTKEGKTELAGKFQELYHSPVVFSAKRSRMAADIAGIMIAALALRLYYAAVHPVIVRDGIFYLKLIQRWFTEGGGEYLNLWPPLYFYLARALMFCGMNAECAALTVNITAGTLLIIPCYLAGKAIWQKHSAGLKTAALAAVMPNLIRFSCYTLRDGLYLHFAAWSIALWTIAIRCEENKQRSGYWWIFLCGIAIAAGSMCRYEMAFLAPFAAVTFAVAALIRQAWQRAAGTILALGSGIVLGLLLLTCLPGMPDIVGIFVNRIRMNFWYWKIWGLQ